MERRGLSVNIDLCQIDKQGKNQIHLCEPGLIRSPDGKQLAVLLRENKRVRNSHVIFSNDNDSIQFTEV